MADTKWLDPASWTLADWEDETRRPLLNFLWDTLRGGANERVAFYNQTHDSSFPTNYDFPDYNTDKSVALASDYLKIRNAVWPSGLKDSKTMKNTDMVDGGTVTSNSDIPDELQLNDILSELSYSPDTTMLHVTDTSSGTQSALARMAWVKQWYEIMNYITWVNRTLTTTGYGPTTSDLISDIEFQQYKIAVFYGYNPNTSTFNSATCYETEPRFTSTPVDIYTANDLNETAPFSTMQEVRDYAITQIDPDNATWVSTTRGDTLFLFAKLEEQISNEALANNYTIDADYELVRLRFKINDSFRATSPNRFTSDIYWFLYYTHTVGTFSDFGNGFSEDDNSLIKLTADGSGWYYLEIDPDFDHEPVLSVPAIGTGDSQTFQCVKRTISPNMAFTATENSIYQKPNLTAGTAWEWYTPAP